MKFLLGMPTGRALVHTDAMKSVINALSVISRRGATATFATVSYAEPSVARNVLAGRFLDSDADILIMQDDDVAIHPDVLGAILDRDAPFTGVFLPQRQLDMTAFVAGLRDGLSERAARRAAAPMVGPNLGSDTPHEDENRIVPVPWIGAGFLVLQRAVFEAIDRTGQCPRYRFEVPGRQQMLTGYFDNLADTDGTRLGEDISFCRRYTDTGGKVFAYHGQGITHYGMTGFPS